MNLLDNELVRKYFSCAANKDACGGGFSAADHTAYRVICAMHEPIKKGDHFLWYTPSGVWVELEDSAGTDHPGPFHGYVLRLPDAFQRQEKVHALYCQDCGVAIEHDAKPAPSPEKCIADNHGASCHCFKCVDCGEIGDSWWHNHHFHCSPKDVAERISELICHWFSNGLIGTPNPGSLTVLLRDLVRLARETR